MNKTYKITWDKAAEKELRKLAKPEAKRIIDKIESDLPNSAHKHELLQGFYSGHRKFRVGNYRVIYFIIEDIVTIEIVKVGHRSNVYK